MTVCSKPKSFKYGELGHSASASACSNSTSMASLCTFMRENSNTTTTDEDDEMCSSADTSLSLPSLSSEEEDWKQFGYLLDFSDSRLDSDSTVPYHQQFYEPPSFLRSNSSPAASKPTPALLKSDPGSQMEVSSVDVEISSSTDLDSSITRNQCDRNTNSDASVSDDEPVAKRTRHNLAMKETMDDSLSKLSNVSKEEVIYNFLQSSPKTPVKPIRNMCRPWWHKKIQNISGVFDDKLELVSASEEENEKAVRKPKEVSNARFGSRFVNAESQNTQSEHKEIMIKTEPAFVKQEIEDPKFSEEAARKNLCRLDMIKSQTLSPSSHSADDETSPNSKASRNRKRVRPSPSKAKQNAASRSSTTATARKQNRRQQKVIQSAEDENEDGSPVLDPKKKHCSCGTPYDPKKFYLMCDRCRQWFHGKCVGITEKKSQKMDAWMCVECEKEKAQYAEELYCVCRQPYDEARFYVGCDSCEDWFHPECINCTKEEVTKCDQFICPKCRRSTDSGEMSD